MKSLSRVVWSEGMYIGPHHFQAQSRYFEDSIEFATSALFRETSGLLGLTMDTEALRNGTLNVLTVRGILPDGLLFQMPECDPLPDSRQIQVLIPPSRDKVIVYLAIAKRSSGGRNTAISETDNRDAARYIARDATIPDETNGLDEKPVRLGTKNIRLLLETELKPDLIALPIARVMRDGRGGLVCDPSFIPPCVQISASDVLMNNLQRLIEIVDEKSASLTRAPDADSGQSGYSSREVANFWFLHTLNANLAPLRHLFYSKRGHPEELYVQLSRLSGALCTFTLDSHPRTVPPYNHERPDDWFGVLDTQIRERLELLIPTNCISIPLTNGPEFFYHGAIVDQRCLGRSQWIFGIRAAMGEAELLAQTPKLIKICSKVFVAELMKRAMPGLSLTHLPTPPAAVSAKLETVYFLIDKKGPCWSHLMETRQVGVYIPGEFPSPEPELLVVLET